MSTLPPLNPAISEYDIGNPIRMSIQFRGSGGMPQDPGTIKFVLLDPTKTQVASYTFGVDSQLVRDGVGLYHVDYVVTSDGPWRYAFTGTTPVITHREFFFRVRTPKVPYP